MGPDDLLCSRNARPPKALVGRAQWKLNQPPSLKVTSKLGRNIYRSICAGKGSLSLQKAGEFFVILLGDGIKATLLHQVQQFQSGACWTLFADLPLLHRRNARVQEAGKRRLADP